MTCQSGITLKMRLHVSIIFAILIVGESKALNILGIFPYQGKSHFDVFQPYLQELAKIGHNVTVISYFPEKNPVKNYHDITLEAQVMLESTFKVERSYLGMYQIIQFVISMGAENCKTLLENKNVQNLWMSKANFDVVVVEQFNSDCSLGLAYKLGAPVVGISSCTTMPWYYERFGIPNNPSYVPLQFLEGGTKPTFYQRIERTIFNKLVDNLYKSYSQNVDQNTLAQYFDDVPHLEELGRNINILLVYTHPVLFGSTLLPANVIEVNGFHVAKPQPLSQDLQKFIDESEHGVIFISFGSMLQSTTTPLRVVKAITDALAELPQRVIWKWGESSLPGNPKNILLSNWLPQNDILAHPNVVAFFSHCGLLSTTEAVYHGVPIVGMPVFGDQPINAGAIEESGFGVQIQIGEITKEILLEKFRTVLNPKFKHQVKELSKAWHTRPVSPMDNAVFWTEFVAQNPNLKYRTAAADVPYYQYLALDILGLVILIMVILIYIISLMLSTNKVKVPKSTPKKVKFQ